MNGNGGRGVHLESTYLGRGSSRKRMFVYRERGLKFLKILRTYYANGPKGIMFDYTKTQIHVFDAIGKH